MLQNQMLNKTKQSLECRIITMCIVIFLCLQLILQFLNQECYFLLSGFYFPLVVVCFFGVLLTMKRINHFNGQTILSIVLLAIVLINCIIHNEYVDRGYLLTYVLIFTVMFVFSLAKFTKKQFKLMSYSYVLAAVIITLFMIVFRVRYYALDVTRITINVFGNTKIDPNYLAGFLVAPVFIALKGWGEEEKPFAKFICCLSAVLIAVGVFLTGSRGAFLAVIIGGIIVLLNLKIKITEQQMKYVLVIGVLCIIGIIIALQYVPQETIARIFDIENWADSSNMRRIELWRNALTAISKSPILGLGVYPTADLIGQVTGQFSPAHCTYLEVWLQIGVVGLIGIIVLAFVGFIKNKNPYTRAIIVATLVVAIFISAEANFFFWFNLLFPILFKEKKEKKSEVQVDGK